MNSRAVIDHIVQWLDDYSKNAGTNGFIVGVSGGIDSAVTSSLVSLTGQPVVCLEMPIHQAESQVSRARKHIARLEQHHSNVSSHWVELTPVFDSFIAALPSVDNEEERHLTPVSYTHLRAHET